MSLSRLIGWVWMQRSGADPRRRTRSTSPLVAKSKSALFGASRRRDLRQGLQCVVELDARQRRAERAVLRTDALRIDDEQRRAVAAHQVLDRLARERVLARIEPSERRTHSTNAGFGRSWPLLRPTIKTKESC